MRIIRKIVSHMQMKIRNLCHPSKRRKGLQTVTTSSWETAHSIKSSKHLRITTRCSMEQVQMTKSKMLISEVRKLPSLVSRGRWHRHTRIRIWVNSEKVRIWIYFLNWLVCLEQPIHSPRSPWTSTAGRSTFVDDLKRELGLRSEAAKRGDKYQ